MCVCVYHMFWYRRRIKKKNAVTYTTISIILVSYNSFPPRVPYNTHNNNVWIMIDNLKSRQRLTRIPFPPSLFVELNKPNVSIYLLARKHIIALFSCPYCFNSRLCILNCGVDWKIGYHRKWVKIACSDYVFTYIKSWYMPLNDVIEKFVKN